MCICIRLYLYTYSTYLYTYLNLLASHHIVHFVQRRGDIGQLRVQSIVRVVDGTEGFSETGH
jgi:hypothetical protein